MVELSKKEKQTRNGWTTAWIYGLFFCIITPTLTAVPWVLGDRHDRKSYISLYTDDDCRSAPKSIIRPYDDGVCSTIDNSLNDVLSYKFSKLGGGCSVWIYPTNDTTCSALNSSQLLTWRQCINAPNNTHFVLQCNSPVQPYRDPSLPPLPVTASVGFKLGMGLAIPAVLYVLLGVGMLVYWNRKDKKAEAAYQASLPAANMELTSSSAEKDGGAVSKARSLNSSHGTGTATLPPYQSAV